MKYKNSIKFFKQYIKNPSTIGAVLPSSEYLAKKMIEKIDFNKAKYIAEYGPGTGIFTEQLIKNKHKNTLLFLIELNSDFAEILTNKYKNEDNVFVINGSAEKIQEYLNKYGVKYLDYVISGLPFASLPKNISSSILSETNSILSEDGSFITFQYTLFKKRFMKSFFKEIIITKEFRNFPPAFVFYCSKN